MALNKREVRLYLKITSFFKISNIDVFICLFMISPVSIGFAAKNDCRMSQLDARMKPLTRFVREATWPINEKEMSEICRAYPEHISAARIFMKNCVKGMSKTIVSVAIHGSDKQIKVLCKNKMERQKFIASGKCANAGTKSASKCWAKMVSSITKVANVTESKIKFPLLCCSLLRWKDCFLHVYEGVGTPVCTDNNIDYFDQFLYKQIIESLNIFCGEYDESDKCQKFNDFLITGEQTKDKYLTLFPAIVSLFQSL